MKMWKKFLTSVLTAAMCFGLLAGNVLAAEKEAYHYTVTFYAGNQGNFGGTAGLSVKSSDASVAQSGDMIVIRGLSAGDVVSFNAQTDVALDATSKYYVQGVRLSGRDNDTVSASVFTVDGDADYVVAYGIKGSVVSYTVNYYDESGNALIASETFYGNVGDKPVIAYKYVEGYVPQALGLTKTLSADEAQNVFTFEYEKIPTPTTGTGTTTQTGTTTGGTETTTGITDDANAAGNTSDASGTGTDQSGTTDGAAGGENDGDTAGGTQAEHDGDTAGETETGNENEEDSQILDLDDEETPLANIDLEKDSAEKSLPLVAYVGMVLAAVAALIAVIVTSVKRRMK